MGSWFGLSGYLPQKYAQKDMERDMEPDNGGLEDDYVSNGIFSGSAILFACRISGSVC